MTPTPQTSGSGSLAGEVAGQRIERHFVAFCRWLLQDPPAERTDAWIRIITGLEHPFGNFGVVTDAAGASEACAPLAELDVPSALIFLEDPGEEVGGALEALGYERGRNTPAMAIRIKDLGPAELPVECTFEEAGPKADAEFCRAFAEGYEIPLGVAELFGPAAAARAGAGVESTHFVAREGGRIVATSNVSVIDGVAGVYCVSTIPEARGRGLGAYVTTEPLRRAGERGLTTAILHSSEMGDPIYRRLGFSEHGQMALFVRMPG